MQRIQKSPILVELEVTNIHKIYDNSKTLQILESISKYLMNNVEDIKVSYMYRDRIVLVIYRDYISNPFCISYDETLSYGLGLKRESFDKILSKLSSMATMKLYQMVNCSIAVSGTIKEISTERVYEKLKYHQRRNMRYISTIRKKLIKDYCKEKGLSTPYREDDYYNIFSKHLRYYNNLGIVIYRDGQYDLISKYSIIFKEISYRKFMQEYMYRFRVHNRILTCDRDYIDDIDYNLKKYGIHKEI